MAFVGQERYEIVERLVNDFEHVVAGRGPKVVVLSSPPGWGKTRITQEFYRRIAANQSVPRYWPAELVDENGLSGESQSMNSLLQARKLVYPRVVDVPKGASMDWMWWGVLCQQRRNGEFSEALFESVSQLNAHAAAIAAPTKGQALDITMNLVGVLGALGVVTLGAPIGAALTITGAGKTAFNNRDLVTQLRGWWTQRKGNEINLSRGRPADDIGNLSRNLAQVTKNKPLVLIIDDAHDADESLTTILDGLLKARAKVLVIMTTWPGSLSQNQNRPIARWWLSLNSHNDAVARKEELQPLEAADLQIVAGEDGLITSADVSALNGNVLALRASLRLPAVQREIDAGRKPDLSRYAKGPDAVFHEYWDDLPSGVRHVLAIAAQTGAQYVPSIVVAASLHAGIEDAQRNLIAGVDVYRLAREIDANLHAFTDSLLYAVAEKRGREHELSDTDYSAIRAALASAVLDSELLGSLSNDARLLVHRQHLLLVREGLLQPNDSASRSAFIVAQAEAARYSYSSAVEISGLAIEWHSKFDAAETLSRRHENAYWLGESGDTAKALELLREILTDQIRVMGSDHEDTLSSRFQIAWFTHLSGKTSESISMYEELLTDELRVLGPNNVQTLRTVRDLADCLSATGRFEESIELLVSLLADVERVLGFDSEDALVVRNNLARNLGAIGHVEEAVRRLLDLVEDCNQIIGPDHHETLRVRGILAHFLGKAGRTQEAFDMTSAVLNDEIRVLGNSDIYTLTTRMNLAELTGKLGNPEEAVNQLTSLLNDILRTHGAEHPTTLMVRNNLACRLGELGNFELAIAQLSDVLLERIRIEGIDNPNTFYTRLSIAVYTADAGRPTEAIEQLVQLEKDRIRVLGSAHPETFSTRLHIISLLEETGNISQATEFLKVLIDEQTIALGPDHADTVLSRDILQLFEERGF
jgi:hypothetical protein